MRLVVRTLKALAAGRSSLPPPDADAERLRAAYLDLMQACLLGTIYRDPAMDPKRQGMYDPAARENGRDWPSQAHSMIGRKRMQNLRHLVERVLVDKVPGDLIETGVWRGGACIYMRAVLQAYGVSDRCVWVADSFQGLPPPDAARYPADAGDLHYTLTQLAVSLDEVKANFDRYGLLDAQVRFLPGWFKDTLPTAPLGALALMRLDGDMYESTMDALVSLYERLSPGGFVIIDDYKAAPCRQAVHDFREQHKIVDALEPIDDSSVYWRRFGG